MWFKKLKLALVIHKIFKVFFVLYGVKGYQNDVPTSVWDKFVNYKMALLNFKR